MKIDSPIIDAHLHLNLKETSPLESLLQNMLCEKVERCVLILNNPDERNAFFKEFNLYERNKYRFYILSGINVNDQSSVDDYERLIELGCLPGIKIHPRFFGVTMKDLPWYIDFCKQHPQTPIMVDSLFYGEHIENHIGVEFGVQLARQFTDRKIIMAHSGSLDFLKCMMATRYMDHVYYDYSFILSFFNKTSLRLDMVDFLRRTSFRIMYGSDYPSFKMDDCKKYYWELIEEAGLNEKQIKDTFINNALEVYWNKSIL